MGKNRDFKSSPYYPKYPDDRMDENGIGSVIKADEDVKADDDKEGSS